MAASVLPTPVGAINRTLEPEAIVGQAADWARVGSARPLSSRAFNNLGFIFIVSNRSDSPVHRNQGLPGSRPGPLLYLPDYS